MDIQKYQKNFLLLQINDALFPIGAYSHSYGLETYIQKNLVCTAQDAWDFIRRRMQYGFCYSECLSARLAYEYGENGQFEQIAALEDLLEAGRLPSEIRQAANKLGSRFIKTLTSLDIAYESDVFERYCRERKGRTVTHSVAYGLFCQSCGISCEDALEHYLYAQTSSMVTNCVKSVPLSQTDGQRLLRKSQELCQEILCRLPALTLDDLCLSAPGFDIRSMQHEGLYSRIYMS